MKQDTSDWYNKAEDMKDEAIQSLEEDIKPIAEQYAEKYNVDEEITKSLENRDRDSEGNLVKRKVIFSYNLENDELEWVMVKKEVDREEDKNYITTDYLNAFLTASETAIDIIEEEYDHLENTTGEPKFSTDLEDVQEFIQETRMNTGMEQVKEMIRNHQIDRLLTLLGKNEDYVSYIWKFMTYYEGGDRKNTDPEFLTENNNRLAIRAKRKYDGENHVVGFVIGIDDTPDRFFIHRLQNPKNGKLQDDEHEWEDREIREMMGFDHDLNPSTAHADVSNGVRFRVQGDLRLTKGDFHQMIVEETERRIVSQHGEEFLSERLNEERKERNVVVSGDEFLVRKYGYDTGSLDTEELKELQDKLSIEEERVRQYQERDGIQSLHPSRRQEYIEEALVDKLVQEKGKEYEEIKEEVENNMQDTEKSVGVVGNHMVIIQDAGTTRSFNVDGFEVVIPTDTNVIVLHDEHNPKKFRLPQGKYVFDFLDRNIAENLQEMF